MLVIEQRKELFQKFCVDGGGVFFVIVFVIVVGYISNLVLLCVYFFFCLVCFCHVMYVSVPG